MAECPPPQDPLLLIDIDKQSGAAAKFRFKLSVPPRALYWFMSILGAGSTGWAVASRLPDIARLLGH